MRNQILLTFLSLFLFNSTAFALGCMDRSTGRRLSTATVCEEMEVSGGVQLDQKYQIRETVCRNPITNRREACNKYDIDVLGNRAGDAVISEVNNRGFAAIQAQEQICKEQYDQFKTSCNYNEVIEANHLIAEIKVTIEDRTSQLANLNAEASKPEFRSNTSVLGNMLTKATELKQEIEAANTFLTNQKTFIEDFTKSCNKQIEIVRSVCTDPTYSTIGDKVNISIFTTSQTQTLDSVDAVKTAHEGEAEATVQVQTSGTFPALGAEDNKNRAVGEFNIATRERRQAVETWAVASTTVSKSGTLADQVIAALTPLVGRSNESDIGCDDDLGLGCSASPSTSTPDPLSNSNTSNLSFGTPVESSGSGSGTPAARAKTSAGGNGGGVSADQISADASSTAYGATGGSGAGSPSGAAGGSGFGSATGGLSSVMGGLSSLAPVFGKTGGGFGTDSSYGSTRSNLRSGGGYGGSGSYKTSGNNNPNSNYNYRSGNKNSQGTTNSPDGNSPRSFGNTPQFNSGYGMPMGGAGGGNAGSTMGGSSGGSGSKEKPGFINRLLGRQKDKTLFGKRSSGGGSGMGGSFGSKSRSGLGSNSDMDSFNGKTTSNDNARVFDASKYAPSKAAQDRAYARATGRKIASQVNEVSVSPFEWPKDISTDKNGNLFRKAGLSVRVNLSK